MTELVLAPHDFLRRLAALTPSPYTQLVRYRGVFARRARLRSRLASPPIRVEVGSRAHDARRHLAAGAGSPGRNF